MSDRVSDRSLEDVAVDGVREREGLPPGYRMRADRHYVDQLAAPAAGQPVRMLPIGQVELETPRSNADLRPLIESVRVHGIVQPLLVRRRDSRFVVVAGRKRLMVAQMLRLQTVPCLVHELNDSEAAALAAAENLSVGEPAARIEPGTPDFGTVRRLIETHVATIRSCADISTGVTRDAGLLNRSALDLLKAHAWRAAQLLAAADLLSTSVASSAGSASPTDRALATIVDEVINGFAPEARLGGIDLCVDIREALTSSGLNHRQLFAGLIGALMATLPLVEQTVEGAVTIKASGAGGGVLFEVIQTDVPVDPRLMKRFFQDDASLDRPGGYAATLGALVVKAVAGQHGGDAAFEAIDHGSRLTMLVMRRS